MPEYDEQFSGDGRYRYVLANAVSKRMDNRGLVHRPANSGPCTGDESCAKFASSLFGDFSGVVGRARSTNASAEASIPSQLLGAGETSDVADGREIVMPV